MAKLASIIATIALAALLAGCATNDDPWTDTLYLTTLNNAGEITTYTLTATDITTGNITSDTMQLGGKPLYPSSHAELYLNAGASVDILTPGTYYMVDGASTIYETEDFDNTGTNTRLTYTGVDTKHFLFVVSLSVECDTVNTLTTWNVYRNGSPHPSSAISNLIGIPGDTVALSMNNLDEMSKDGYIEVYVTADKACTLTIDYMTIDVVSVN